MTLINKVYPANTFKTEIFSPVVVIYRISSLPLLVISKILNLHPNFITFISFITLFLAAYFAYSSLFVLAGIFIFFTCVLDCVDGELARLSNKETKLGQKLESIHADLTLILFPSTTLIGLINTDSIQIWVLLLLLFSTSIYVKWRSAYSSSLDVNPSQLSYLKRIIYSQQKSNNEIRNSSFIGKILFILRINTSTQLGISFALITLFSFINPELIVYSIWTMIISQLFFGCAVIFGKILFTNLE